MSSLDTFLLAELTASLVLYTILECLDKIKI